MKQFAYAKTVINVMDGTLTVLSTEPSVWEVIERKVRAKAPNCRVSSDTDIDDVQYKVAFNKLGQLAGGINWWIFRHLCHSGWEPMPDFQFRLAIEE